MDELALWALRGFVIGALPGLLIGGYMLWKVNRLLAKTRRSLVEASELVENLKRDTELLDNIKKDT
jgi:hypothetical protein